MKKETRRKIVRAVSLLTIFPRTKSELAMKIYGKPLNKTNLDRDVLERLKSILGIKIIKHPLAEYKRLYHNLDDYILHNFDIDVREDIFIKNLRVGKITKKNELNQRNTIIKTFISSLNVIVDKYVTIYTEPNKIKPNEIRLFRKEILELIENYHKKEGIILLWLIEDFWKIVTRIPPKSRNYEPSKRDKKHSIIILKYYTIDEYKIFSIFERVFSKENSLNKETIYKKLKSDWFLSFLKWYVKELFEKEFVNSSLNVEEFVEWCFSREVPIEYFFKLRNMVKQILEG